MKKAVGVSALFVVALLCGLSTPLANAQAVYGSIIGTVTDPQGAAVANAKVLVVNQNKGTTEEATTNENGNYSVTHLVPDVYRVKVEAQGFKATEQKDVIVSADVGARVDLALQLGAASESVEVTAEAAQLKTDRADVATTFSERAVESLPVYNRNFTGFQLLQPGNAYQTGFQHAASENPQGSQQILTQGQHFSGTAFQLDGTDNQDPILGIIVINPNLEAIQEVKLTSQNYDAEFGKAIGSLVTTQTKSGTNDLHGSIYDYQRSNTNFAVDKFTKPTPPAPAIPSGNWNEFGVAAGGPIVKNKWFIFGDYQGLRSHVGTSGTARIPTTAERGGNLSDLGINIYDPYLTSDTARCNLVLTGGQPTPANPALRAQFPGNVIPACRLSPAAQNLLSLFSGITPNTTGNTIFDNNYTNSGSNVLDSNGFDLRSDYSVSQKLTTFGRYSYQKYKRSGPGLFGTALGGPSLPSDLGGFAGDSTYKNQSLAAGFDYTFGSTLLTDFRFGYLRYYGNVTPGGAGTTPATTAGAPGLNLGSAFTSGMPYFQIHQGSGADPQFKFGYALDVNACNCPLLEQEHQYQFVNNWTKISGNHTYKFGGDARYAYNLRIPSDRHRAGQLEFENGLTSNSTVPGSGSGLAAFLLGDVTHFQRFVSSSLSAYETQPRFFFYGQDSWRVTNKFTLTYGLRWELYRPESVKGTGLGGWVDPVTGEMRVAGQNGVNLQGNTHMSYKHLAPRLGIAYQVNQKTVVRMGYGRSYDLGVFGTTFGHIVTQNLPVLAAQEYRGNTPGAQDTVTAFVLDNGPFLLDPASALQSGNCNPITDPTLTKTQCLGPNGRPMVPDGVSRDIRNFNNTIPVVDAWNASVQRQLTPTMSLTVSFVGNKATHTTAGDGGDYNLNEPTNVGYVNGCTDTAGGVPNATCIATGGLTPKQRTPYYGTSAAYPFPSATFPKGLGGNFGWTGGDRYQSSDQNAKYSALQIQLDKRFSKGLSIISSYTFQHAIDQEFSSLGFVRYENIDPSVTYGPNESYRNHELIFTEVYELPFGKGKTWASNVGGAANAIIGGWSINSTTRFQSGLPWTPGLNSCAQSIDQGPCIADVKGSVKDGSRSGDPTKNGYWFQTANCAVQPSSGLGATCGPWGQTATLDAFGNGGGGVGQFRGPRFFDTDASIFKSFGFGERAKAQFEFKFYNLFNHVNLDRPQRCVDCSNGGAITALTPGAIMRRLEFGAKVTF